MEFLSSSTPSAEGRATVVTGSSLSEAFKKVRREFGPEAAITGSRTRTRRKSSGWGTEKVIEVLVETQGTEGFHVPAAEPAEGPDLVDNIRCEVERLERIVEEICRPQDDELHEKERRPGNLLAEFLVENGASPGTVERLLTRFTGETGQARNDRPAAIAWLMTHLGTGEEDLADWRGNHAFLGEHARDRLDLVLDLAGSLTLAGRRVLVVSVLPDPDRDVTRLQNLAAAAGYDAAVVRDVGQLEDIPGHLTGYDLVLLDLPSLTDPALSEGGTLQQWLASNSEFHRHLQIPLERDFQDLADLREAARIWNCDWLALTRMDGTRRPAKLLDLFDSIPLPVSIMADNLAGTASLSAATPERLLDRILTQAGGHRSNTGMEAESA